MMERCNLRSKLIVVKSLTPLHQSEFPYSLHPLGNVFAFAHLAWAIGAVEMTRQGEIFSTRAWFYAWKTVRHLFFSSCHLQTGACLDLRLESNGYRSGYQSDQSKCFHLHTSMTGVRGGRGGGQTQKGWMIPPWSRAHFIRAQHALISQTTTRLSGEALSRSRGGGGC